MRWQHRPGPLFPLALLALLGWVLLLLWTCGVGL